MKREHSAYFEYFVEPVPKSTDWAWRVLVHRIPAVTKEIQVECDACKGKGVPEGLKDPCAKCKGAGKVANKVSVPEELRGTAKDQAAAREAAQAAGKKAIEKHRITKADGAVAPEKVGE